MKNHNAPQSIKEVLSALADGEVSGIKSISEANDAGGATTEDEVIELACQDQEVRAAWQSMHLVRDVLQADYHAALAPDFSARVSAAVAQEEQFFGDDPIDDAQRPAAPVASLADAREQRIRGAQPVRRRPGSAPGSAPISAPAQNTQQPFVFWKPVAGLGLAASLAGAAFLLPQLWQSSQTGLVGTPSAEVAQVETQPEIRQVSGNTVASSAQTLQENALENLTLQAAVRIGNDGTRWRMDNDVTRNVEIEKRLNTLLTNHLEDASMGRLHGLVSHSRVVGYDTVPSEQ